MRVQERSIAELERLGAILDIQDGNHGEIHPKASDYVDAGIPFVMASDISGGQVNIRDCSKITEEQARGLRKGFSVDRDVLLTHKGTVGLTAIVKGADPFWMLTPQVTYYRVDESLLLPEFLNYAFRMPSFRKRMITLADQATRPYIGITAQRNLRVNYADPEVQIHIVGLLKPYDDLIENNRRRIKLLEEAARLIYREWFVRLRFPGHEHTKIENGMPEGWAKQPFDDIADVSFGYAFKSNLFNQEEIGRPIIRIRDVLGGETRTYTPEEAPEDRLVFDGDLLVGMDGEFHMGFWSGGTAWLNQRVCRISGKNGVSTGLLRYVLEKSIRFFNDTNVGTTVTHLSAKDIRSIETVLPFGVLLEEISGILESFRQQAVLLRKQNRQLSKARDLLLPRLMSGEVEV